MKLSSLCCSFLLFYSPDNSKQTGVSEVSRAVAMELRFEEQVDVLKKIFL